MRLKSPLKFGSLKLHTKTTIFISAVLIAVFAIIAYFYDEFTTQISTARENAWAELMAHRVADTVEFHIKKERKKGKDASQDEETFNWNEVEEYISGTVINSKPGPSGLMNNPSPSEVRVFFLEPGGWQEKVRLPADAGPPFLRPPFYSPARSGSRQRAGPSAPASSTTSASRQEDESSGILLTVQQGHIRLVSAMARVFSPVDSGGPREIANVTVLLAFDETTTVAARLSRLVCTLIARAILSLTLI